MELKRKECDTVLTPASNHGAEKWATTKMEKKLDENETRMVRWMCGVTRRDKGSRMSTVGVVDGIS